MNQQEIEAVCDKLRNLALELKEHHPDPDPEALYLGAILFFICSSLKRDEIHKLAAVVKDFILRESN